MEDDRRIEGRNRFMRRLLDLAPREGLDRDENAGFGRRRTKARFGAARGHGARPPPWFVPPLEASPPRRSWCR